ncbi:MAG TPA: RluA family pseudouridine synthase [Thermodesulfobacteriota bacterium]|nr:RluA family pseudouridine synthase [Thermodesulfobacteriota bacterium]
MNSILSFLVHSQDSSKRLDVFLSQKGPALSRSQIKKLIETGKVQIDGRKAKAGLRLRENEVVTLTIPEPRRLEIEAEAIPLKVLYEDRHLIVVDKPAGLVVHPGAGNYSGTLVNALLHRCPDLAGIGGVLRPGIVHRLDKDTSGVLVVAKDDLAHRSLSDQFRKHTAERNYVGIVFGQLSEEGQVDAPVGRHPTQRKKMSARPWKGREARTYWRVLERFRSFNLAEFRLQTGRTHQIRVHLSSIGHPILGDPLYGGRKRLASVESLPLRQGLRRLKRQALHATSLGFVHPVTGDVLKFSSPLPEDIQEAIALLRRMERG